MLRDKLKAGKMLKLQMGNTEMNNTIVRIFLNKGSKFKKKNVRILQEQLYHIIMIIPENLLLK